ncbi:MAG: FeoA family protein [Spirochaetaceae bacterium]
MQEVRLRDVPVGGRARVAGFRDTDRSYRARLLSMGLTRGTPLRVRGVAPFGDPVHILLRGYELTLRREEADALVLELAGDGVTRPGHGPGHGAADAAESGTGAIGAMRRIGRGLCARRRRSGRGRRKGGRCR